MTRIARTLTTLAAGLAGLSLVVHAQTPAASPRVVRAEFARTYQGNFGSIRLPGCGVQHDVIFDPHLLYWWAHDRRCFDAAMDAHASRGDNRIVIDPSDDYNRGHSLPGGDIDMWHEPARFRAFIDEVRSRTNSRGEHVGVLLFLAGDAHFGKTMLRDGKAGEPDPAVEAHWHRDLRAMADATRDVVDGTAVCWECRPVTDYMTVGQYERGGQLIAQLWPDAWHGQHLTPDASSWVASTAEGDDPNHGDRIEAWHRCRREQWCDGLLFQFQAGEPYLRADRTPGNPDTGGHRGAMGRWWEVVKRLGNDPRASHTSQGNRHGWPQVDVIAFEHIHDAHWGRSDEAYGLAWCRKALEIGGWGCGSASYRPDRAGR